MATVLGLGVRIKAVANPCGPTKPPLDYVGRNQVVKAEVNERVASLYGLTREEIALIEAAK
jgi:hypothetical protein